MASVIGPNITVFAVPATRPSIACGVYVCTAVTAATSVHGRPTPITTEAATVPGHHGRQRPRQPAANRTAPVTPTAISPWRRTSRPTTSPASSDPPPCALASTPRKVDGSARPVTTTSYSAAVVKPDIAMDAAASATGTRTARRASSAASPSRTPAAGAVGRAGSARVRRSAPYRAATSTGTTAASTATTCPPRHAYRPAPASGATSFMPSCALDRQPLTSASRAGGSAAGSSAVSPASTST